jgi:hypothetical protein
MDAPGESPGKELPGQRFTVERTTIQVVDMRRCALIFTAIISLPMAARAQTSPDSITGNASPVAAPAALSAFESIPIKTVGSPITLKNRGIYPGTEVVSLDGQGLAKNVDYRLDNLSGVLTLLRPVNLGQVLRVTYQYDMATQPTALSQQALAIDRAANRPFNRGPAPVGMDMGVRSPVGGGLASGLYGWNSSLHLGSVGARGLMLFTSKPKPHGLFATSVDDSTMSGTDSQFIVQSVATSLLKGTVTIDYQNISSNFNGFNSVRAAGYDQDVVDQLQKEAGLKRLGVALQNVSVGGSRISTGFKSVQDESGKVDWRNFSLQNGGLKLNYTSQRVAQGFSRFSDLAEKDRDQLMKEAGMYRQSFNGEYKLKNASFALSANQITDEYGQSILRRQFKFDGTKLKLAVGDQNVASAFSRFDSLFETEKAQWAKEQGLHRQWFSLETAPIEKGGQPVKVAINNFISSTGSIKSEDFSAGGRNWGLQISERRTDPQFDLQNALSDAEVDLNVQAVAKMYQASGIGTGAGDRAAFLQGAPVDRTGIRFTAQPLKGWNLNFEQVRLNGQMDSANLQTFAMTSKNLDISVKKEFEGEHFVETPQLFTFEQQRFGNLLGLTKADFALNWRLGGFKRFSLTEMTSDTAAGSAKRETLAYSDKKIDLSFATRQIDGTFANVGAMADPEASLLAVLAGYKERDFKLSWQLSPKLKVDTLWEDQKNDAQSLDSYVHNTLITWDPNKSTHFAYTYLDSKTDNPLEVLFRSRTSSMLFAKDFGKYGKFQYVHENDSAQGTNTNGSPASVVSPPGGPVAGQIEGDSVKDYISYEANLDKNTSLKTEQSRTQYRSGEHENMSANTISRALTKHFGLSYTDLRIDRSGDNRDEARHNYGFWLDLAKGVRLSYGIARDFNNLAGNTSSSTIGITPGNVGLLHVDSASFGSNTWDQLHNQVATNVALKTSKPVRLGFLTNLQFNVGMDTSSDYSAWTRDNKLATVSGNIGSNNFMLEYKSQLDVSGFRGIDRFFKFETDQSDKRWIKASIKIKERSTPNDGLTLIRDYSITLRPFKNLEITNQLLTNPEEQFRPDVLMGSTTSPWRVNKYKLDYHSGSDTTIGATWEDRFNDITRDFSRTGGVDIQLFKKSGSPLTLWYGLEQAGGINPRQTVQRYFFKYYQKAGPNQVFNIFAGNISYEYTPESGFSRNNWTLHLDYQWRFW